MRVTAEQEKRFELLTNRFGITKQLQAVVAAIINSDLSSDDIQIVFDAAAITLHPYVIQNLLARRHAAQAQGS